MTKMLSASGRLRAPDPLTKGSAPGPRWGLRPQTAVIGSCSALAMVSPQPLTPSPRLCLGRIACLAKSRPIIYIFIHRLGRRKHARKQTTRKKQKINMEKCHCCTCVSVCHVCVLVMSAGRANGRTYRRAVRSQTLMDTRKHY